MNLPKRSDMSATNARLIEAAAKGEEVELILVLRGKVRRGMGADRWRIRASGGHVVTFRSESVVAATRVGSAKRP